MDDFFLQEGLGLELGLKSLGMVEITTPDIKTGYHPCMYPDNQLGVYPENGSSAARTEIAPWIDFIPWAKANENTVDWFHKPLARKTPCKDSTERPPLLRQDASADLSEAIVPVELFKDLQELRLNMFRLGSSWPKIEVNQKNIG